MLLVPSQIGTALDNQPLGIEEPAARPRFLFRQALFHQRRSEQLAGAQPSLTRAEKEKTLILELTAGNAHGGEDARNRDRGGALNIIIEAAYLIAILLQKPEGVAVAEILELNHGAREDLLHREDKLLDHIIV